MLVCCHQGASILDGRCSLRPQLRCLQLYRFGIFPVVYRLAHVASGYVYVGSTMRAGERQQFWERTIAPGGSFRVSRRMARAVCEVGQSGWSFEVIEDFAFDVAQEVLWAAELREIRAAQALAGALCLNAGAHKGAAAVYRTDRRVL